MPATLALLKDSFDGKERPRAVCWADCVIGPSVTSIRDQPVLVCAVAMSPSVSESASQGPS